MKVSCSKSALRVFFRRLLAIVLIASLEVTSAAPLFAQALPLPPTIPQLSFPFTGDYKVSFPFGKDYANEAIVAKLKEKSLSLAHNGIDFALPEGTPVQTVDDGEVIKVGDDDFGTTVVVKHVWGESIYGHLSTTSAQLNQSISKYNQIGLSGSTGITDGHHLHFGIRPLSADTANETYGFIDPAPYLPPLTFEGEILGVNDVSVASQSASMETMAAEEQATQSAQFANVSNNPDFLFNYKFDVQEQTTIHFYDKAQKRAGFTVADKDYDAKLRFFLKQSSDAGQPNIENNSIEFPVAVEGIPMRLKYTLFANKVKEEFIIEQKPSEEVLSQLTTALTIPFDLQLVNLQIEQNGSEYIVYNQSKRFLWKLLSPTVEDSAGTQGQISLTLNNGEANLQVDSEFLKTAVYPVIIDPTWTQTNWSGGSGQTSWSDSTKYDSGSNVDVSSTSGQFTLSSSNTWYNTSWGYRKKITIDAAQVSGSSDFTNFPVLINTTDTSWKSTANGGNVASSTGADIVFTSSDGTTKLDHEIEKYTATSGALVAWVEVPTLGATSNTDIYIYYGNSSALSQQNPTGVWDSNYKGVWHLGDGENLSASDATSNDIDGTISNATATTGQIDGGANFDGTNDNINFGTTATVDDIFKTSPNTGTVSFWVKRGATGFQLAFGKTTDVPATDGWGIAFRGAGGSHKLRFANPWSTTAGAWDSNTQFSGTGTWYYITVTYNGSSTSNDPSIYVNGTSETVTEGQTPAGTISSDGTHNLRTGEDDAAAMDLNGVMDEIRFSNTVRSSDWVTTEYNNQNSPSTFYSIASEASPVYNTSGSLTSSIFDSGQSSSWTTLSFTTTTPSNTSASVKFRTSNSSTMSGATAFSSCSAITSGTNAYSNSCVTNGHRYAQYEISLSTTDTASTSTFSDFNVTYSTDVSAPSLSLTAISPDPGSDSTPTLSGTATDATAVSNVEFQVDSTAGSWSSCSADDGTFDETTDTFTCTTSSLSDGSHTIYVRATDSNGNTTSSGSESSDAFTVDATAPTTPGTPSTTTPTTDTTPTWSWTASTDAGEGLHTTAAYTVQWSTNSSFASGASSSTSATNAFTHSTALAEGTWYFRVKAKDTLDNESSYSSAGSVVIDLTSPDSVDVQSPANDAFTNNERPKFRWKVPSDTSGLSKYRFEINNGTGGDIAIDSIPISRTTTLDANKYTLQYENFTDSDNSNNYIALFTKSSSEWTLGENDGKLAQGKRTWQVIAYDTAGNTKTGSRTLYADFTAPTLSSVAIDTVTTIDDYQLVTTTKPKISGKIEDNLAYDKIELSFERQNFFLGIETTKTTTTQTHSFTNTSNQTSLSFSFTLGQDIDYGKYTLTITAIDKAGNRSGGTQVKLHVLTESAAKELIAAKDKEKLKELEKQSKVSLKELEKTAKLRKLREAAELEKVVQTLARFLPDFLPNLGTEFSSIIQGLLQTVQEARESVKNVAIGLNNALTAKTEQAPAALRTVTKGIFEANKHLSNAQITLKDRFVAENEQTITIVTNVFTETKKALQDTKEAITASETRVQAHIDKTYEGASNTLSHVARGVSLAFHALSQTQEESATFVKRVVKGAEIAAETFYTYVFNDDPTTITDVTLEEIGRDFVVVSWKTNHYTTNNKVNYGQDLYYGNEAFSKERAKYHKVTISNLTSGTRYFFEVMSQNRNYAFDAFYSFETTK